MTDTPSPQTDTPPAQIRRATVIPLAEGVHYVSRAGMFSKKLVEQAAVVISHPDGKGQYVLSLFLPGETAREVKAIYNETPQDGTFHTRHMPHDPLPLKSKGLVP